MTSPLRVALALGSGGARGYAHIGAVQVLGERGYEVVAIAGTSMGALVGGLTAAGKLTEFTAWASGLRRRDVLGLIDPAWSAPGAMGAERLVAEVSELVGDILIEDLPIPFTAVATDLTARREVWFQRGPLQMAIRASIAIPGAITPVVINGRLLADGGLMNPVPIEPTAASSADLTLAVSLQGPRGPREMRSPALETAAPRGFDWRSRLRRTLGGTDEAGDAHVPEAEGAASAFEPLPPDLRISDVMSLSLDAMQGLITRYRLAGLPPDVLVTVPVSACRSLDFHRAAEMIALGRTLTSDALDEAGY